MDRDLRELDNSSAAILSNENIAIARLGNSSGLPQNGLVIAIGREALLMLALAG
jgi:hypothetical protein